MFNVCWPFALRLLQHSFSKLTLCRSLCMLGLGKGPGESGRIAQGWGPGSAMEPAVQWPLWSQPLMAQ